MSPDLSPARLARWLFAAVMVALMFSPPLTSLVELALYLLMLGSADLRARLLRAARQPLAAMALAFWGVAALGLAYSIAPWQEGLGSWFAWRRLLLVPIGVALFDDAQWKQHLAGTLVLVATLCALASYFGAALGLKYYRYEIGIVVRNHATQGMVFAVAAFAAVLLLMHAPQPPRARRWLLGAAATLLSINLLFVTPGRSGYAVFAVLAVALLISWLGRGESHPVRRIALAVSGVLVVAAVLASSPLVRQRMAQGWAEMQTPENTPMGIRVVYWRNTLDLVAERPFLGYGTGAFEVAYTRKVAGRSGLDGQPVHDPHNQFLKIVAEHGLAGLLVFLGFLAACLRQHSSAPYRLLGLGVLAAWCVTSMFSSHFSTFSEGRFIALWLGAMLARD